MHNSAKLVGNISVCGTRGWFFDAEEDADKKVLLREAGRLRTSIEKGIALGGEPVVFLHYPPITQDRICPEIYDVLVGYKIKRCFYGHLHSFATKCAFEGERDGNFCPSLSKNSRNFRRKADFPTESEKKYLFWQKI